MLAQLKTVVLIKEAIKLAFFRLVEYLEHQHLWVRLQAQNSQKQITFFWNSSVYSCSEKLRLFQARDCQETCTTLCTPPFTQQRKLALMYLSSCSIVHRGLPLLFLFWLECLVWEKDASQLVASLNRTCRTPVSTSTMKRRLRDAGLLGRVAKKKSYLRLANKKKRLRWAKEYIHWTEEDWKKV